MLNIFKKKKPVYVIRGGFVVKHGRYCLANF